MVVFLLFVHAGLSGWGSRNILIDILAGISTAASFVVAVIFLSHGIEVAFKQEKDES